MNRDRMLKWFLYGYLALVLIFIFAPIIFRSFFPLIPIGFQPFHWAVSRSNGTKPSGRTLMYGKQRETV